MVASNPVPQHPKERFDVYRYFDGISEESRDALIRAKGRVPMVKTFLLEHVSAHSSRRQKPVDEIFRNLGCELFRIDESFWGLRAPATDAPSTFETIGYLESYDPRFFAYYTAERANQARKRVM
ncbi:MAG: hypothetical protein LBK99_14720 [Opitutaceae bacterium]|nr:hypothetical protein [Opitutaceae bacterium]